jgi:hypothetical protein
MANHRGEWVLVNFFATWCTPCRLEDPQIQQFIDSHEGDPVQVVSVAFSDDADSIRDYWVKEPLAALWSPVSSVGLLPPGSTKSLQRTAEWQLRGLGRGRNEFTVDICEGFTDSSMGPMDRGCCRRLFSSLGCSLWNSHSPNRTGSCQFAFSNGEVPGVLR